MPSNSGTPRILFFLEGRYVPASRVRVLQFQALLALEGYAFTNLFSFPNKYLWYPAWLRFRPLQLLLGGIETAVVALIRLFQIACYAPRYDIVYLQRDFLFRDPTGWLEDFLFWVLSLRRTPPRVVFDLDDAIYLEGDGRDDGPMSKKVGSILRRSNEVIVGNRVLASFAARYSSTIVVPSTVSPPAHRPSVERSPPTIGWIGVGSNIDYLSFLEPVLRDLRRTHQFRVLLISNTYRSPFSSAVPVEFLPWSEAEEQRLLSLVDIGIMPLPDSPWARGKCGYKLLQYMGAGIPSIASPVGVNSEIVEHGSTGLIATSPESWRTAFESLLGSPQLRRKLGEAGREFVRVNYSTERWYPVWRDAVLGKLPPQ